MSRNGEIAGMNILVIEDEPKLSAFVKQGLEEQGYAVDVAADGETGLAKALTGQYQVVVLDLMLPLLHGHDVCRAVRAALPTLPLLMLTAMGTTEDTVAGLEMGADDYLVKPFQFPEFLARIRALSRRATSDVREERYVCGDCVVDATKRTVMRADRPITLTPREYALLLEFIQHQGKTYTRAELAEKVWGITFDTGTNVIDVYVNYLRNKIDKGFPTKLIQTVFGTGYVMQAPERS